MLRNEIQSDSLFREMGGLLSPMGLEVVDVTRNDLPGGIQLILTVHSPGKEVDTDDLAKVYNVVYPRYSVIFGDRDLSLEVSSPGLQRTLRDFYEFNVFKGRDVKVYSNKYSSNIEGVIVGFQDGKLKLVNAVVQDTGEEFEELELAQDEVQKAKLTYRWEDK